jgi:hypothetical protein
VRRHLEFGELADPAGHVLRNRGDQLQAVVERFRDRLPPSKLSRS